MNNVPSLDLVEFIEKNILPRYTAFDDGHSLSHVTTVIRRAVKLAASIGADVNMAYVIAAYHDIGLEGPRGIHHLTGGQILAHDARLKQWFSVEQIRIMKEAVEDHRASASRAPRSLYGKIVAEADRDLDADSVFRRAVAYGIAHYTKMSVEGQFLRFKQHIEAKYGPNGYIRLWLPGTESERELTRLRAIINNVSELRAIFNRLYAELQQR